MKKNSHTHTVLTVRYVSYRNHKETKKKKQIIIAKFTRFLEQALGVVGT